MLKAYSETKASNEDAEAQTVFDVAADRCQVVHVGWFNKRLIHVCVFHIDIKDGKIWIQHDGTEGGIALQIKAISQACSSLPVLDDRPADDILGYNDMGLPEERVIDSSALVAILTGEEEALTFTELISNSPYRLLSASSPRSLSRWFISRPG